MLPTVTINYRRAIRRGGRVHPREPGQPARQRRVEADFHHHDALPATRAISCRRRSNWFPGATIAQFVGTTAAPEVTQNDPVKAERSNYFDVSASQVIIPGLTVGVDAYYKIAKNLIDEGQFGAPIILTAFNYAARPRGRRRADRELRSAGHGRCTGTSPGRAPWGRTLFPRSSTLVPTNWPSSARTSSISITTRRGALRLARPTR